jgi:hypothetical protein
MNAEDRRTWALRSVFICIHLRLNSSSLLRDLCASVVFSFEACYDLATGLAL